MTVIGLQDSNTSTENLMKWNSSSIDGNNIGTAKVQY